MSSSSNQSVLNKLNQAGVILSVFSRASYFFQPNSSQVNILAVIKMSNTLVGFYTDSNSTNSTFPINLRTRNSDAQRDYVEIAWKTGGIAFDTNDFEYYNNLMIVIFNKLMFSWGTVLHLDGAIITYPTTNTTLSPKFTYTYTQTIVCKASGSPLPTIRWYNSDNEPVTSGPTLQLDASNISDGRVYICIANNDLGLDSRSVNFFIPNAEINIKGILSYINVIIDTTSEFDPIEAGRIADIVSNILPDTNNISVTEVKNARELLNDCANTIEDIFDKINNTTVSLEDFGKIANTAGNIINRDNELDRIIDSSSLSRDQVNQGGISLASDAMVTAVRIVEKVCLFLGRNSFKDDNTTDSFVINSTNAIDIYGRNTSIANIIINGTFSIYPSADGNNISISRNAALSLAGDQTSLKVVVAIVKRYGESGVIPKGRGPKQASDVIVIVLPDRNGSVPVVENANITFSATPNYSLYKVGSFLNASLWSTNGIITQPEGNTTVKLNVNHFTAFVIFSSIPLPIEYYLSIVSYIISCISVLCLIASLILFILSKKKGFFKFEINILYFNLAIALLVSSILFTLYGLDPDKLGLNAIFCKIVAGLIHYSWILVFTWCFAFVIYITYKIYFGITNKRKIYPYIIIFAWAFPLIIPIITVATKFQVYVDESKHCFPSKQEYIFLSLLVPNLVLSFITLGTLVVMCIRYVNIKREADDEGVRTDIRHIMLSTAIFTSILTVPWIVFMFYNFTDSTAVEWIFVLLNDAMGIWFLIFIALRISEVRYLIRCKLTNEVQQNIIPGISASQNPMSAVNIQLGDLPRYDNLTEESVEITPLVTSAATNHSNRISNSDQPPDYDLMFGDQPNRVASKNPINQSAAVEHTERSNQPIPTPVHPTGTQLDREHPSDI